MIFRSKVWEKKFVQYFNLLVMKRFIKTLLGLFYCRIAGVRYSKGVYVGLGSKLVGGQKSSYLKGLR